MYLAAIQRFLLPNTCVACGRHIEPDNPDNLICRLCISRMRWVRGGCARCAQPLPPVGPCRFCSTWPTALLSARSAVWLTSEPRDVIHHLKYEGYRRLASEIGRIIARVVDPPPGDALVAVPLGERRMRERGYNQAGSIAAELSKLWGIPQADRTLVRIRETPSQTALTPELRLANVAGAFAVTEGRPVPRSVILVDDVLTTGATLMAAATALVAGGARNVRAVTFARAQTFELKAVSV